jgi:hypothetical protein
MSANRAVCTSNLLDLLYQTSSLGSASDFNDLVTFDISIATAYGKYTAYSKLGRRRVSNSSNRRKGTIRRAIWRWLKPDADALMTDRLLDFYDGLREREQIPPPIAKPLTPLIGSGAAGSARD